MYLAILKNSFFFGLACAVFVTPAIAGDKKLDKQLAKIIAREKLSAAVAEKVHNPEKIALGQLLFFDKILSGNKDVACATCHHPAHKLVDGQALSIGVGGQGLGKERRQVIAHSAKVPRNAPDLIHKAAQQSMFWDGRVSGNAKHGFISPAGPQLPIGFDNALAVQAVFPPTSRPEMRGFDGSPLTDHANFDFQAIWQSLVARLQAIPAYVTRFTLAFGLQHAKDIRIFHVGNAIAAFESTSFSPSDSPWDDYLRGNRKAISKQAKKGALLFFGDAACGSCHGGTHFSNQRFSNIAVPPLGPGRGYEMGQDIGREDVTDDPNDRYAFRTPSLRNVSLTAPYMHNGVFASLEEVIEHYDNPKKSLLQFSHKYFPDALTKGMRFDDEVKQDMLRTLDPTVDKNLALSTKEKQQLLAFMNSLSSPSMHALESLVPQSVPSGLPIDGNAP